VFALVLIGPRAAGVLVALHERLAADDLRHEMVETDALTAGRRRRSHSPLLLVAAPAAESEDELGRRLSAAGAGDHAVVRLVAAPADADATGLTIGVEAAEDPAAIAERIRDALPALLRPPAGAPGRLAADSPLARRVADAIRTGTAAALEALLAEHTGLARASIEARGGREARTLLHVVTDWPGHVPEAAAKVAALVAAGADPDARFRGAHTETPLHWAASSDDVEALDALLDAGADIEADGAVAGGGTAIADAVAFGRWRAARRLLERGARTTLWQAAALGLDDRVRDVLARSAVAPADLDNALWCAAHGGERPTAELLLERGADPAWVGNDELTAPQAAERAGAAGLAAWLRARGGAS